MIMSLSVDIGSSHGDLVILDHGVRQELLAHILPCLEGILGGHVKLHVEDLDGFYRLHTLESQGFQGLHRVLTFGVCDPLLEFYSDLYRGHRVRMRVRGYTSAGLRVLLSAQKVMSKQGSMVVKNVNEQIMEVFEVTGFTDILTIE